MPENHKWLPSTLSVFGAAVLLGATALASRVLGLVRDRMLAGTFGAGTELDAYYAAFRVPDLVYSFIVLGALSAGFIPYFTKRLKQQDGLASAFAFTDTVLTIMAAALMVLSGLGALFARQLLLLVAPGFDDATVELAVPLSRLLYLSTFFLGISSVFGGILQSFKRFTLYSIAPLLYNIGIIGGTLVAGYSSDNVMWVAWGVVLGALLHLMLQMVGAVHSGWRPRWGMAFKDADVRAMFGLMGPRVLGLAITQINLIVMTAIASVLSIGSVSIFHFANNIQYVPVGVIGVAFAIAVFPHLSDAANDNNQKVMARSVSQTTRSILFLIIPITVVMLLLRTQIVRVVLGAGVFGWNETIIAATMLGYFALSLFAQSLTPLYVRVFFANKNTVIPTLIALLTAFVNVAFALWWTPKFGVTGIAMAFSLSACVQCVLLWIALRVYVASLDELRLLRMLVTSVGAALVAGLMIQAVKELYGTFIPLRTFLAVVGQIFVAGGAGMTAYLVTAWAFKSEEYEWFVAAIRRKLFCKYAAVESGDEALDMTV